MKKLNVVLAVVAIAAIVFACVFGVQKGDLQKSVDELKAQVTSLTGDLDAAKKEAADPAAKAEAAVKEAEEKAAQAVEEVKKAAEEAAAKAAEEAKKAEEEAKKAAEEAAAKAAEEAKKAEEEAAAKAAEEAKKAEAAKPAGEDQITLDVIICEYGNNTREWFLGKGMNGTSFVEKFEAENPGIKLNLEVISWSDVHKEVSTRISNNNAPDILNIDTFSEFQADGLLLPVKDYCPDDLFNDFFPAFIQESVIDGTVWAVPDLASARALYYNKKIFDEVGIKVPETWAELKDACQQIKDFYNGEVYGVGLDLTEDEGQVTFAYFAWGNNGGFVDADGKWALNSDANVEAVECIMDLINKGYANPSPSTQTRYELQDLFGAGKLAMVFAPNQLPQYLAEKGFKVDFATADIPHNEGATGSSVGVMDRVMAFKDDAYPDQAKRNEAIGKFLKFFYNPENYVGWVSMETFLPAVNSAVGALVASDPSFEAWLNVLGNARFYPAANPQWADVRNGVVVDVEQRALTGEAVKPLLDALQTRIAGE